MKFCVKPLPILATLALGLGAAAVGHAQDTAPVQKPLSIKIGASFPTQSNGRDVEGSTAFSAGLDYAFVKSATASPTLPSVYFDYAGGSKHGGRLDTYGLGVGIRQYTNGAPTGGGVSPYVGAGVGAYLNDVKNTGGDSSTKTVLGGKVLAGLELAGGEFVEANYSLIGSNKGANPSGFGLQLGFRF